MYFHCTYFAVWSFCSLHTAEPKADLQILNCLGGNSETLVQSTHHTTQTTPNHTQYPFLSNCSRVNVHLQVYYMPIYEDDGMFSLCSVIFVNISPNVRSVQETFVFTQICHKGLSACKEWCALCMCCLLCLMHVYQHRYVLWVL